VTASAGRTLRSQRIATPSGIRPAAIHISGGRIAAVTPFDQVPPGAELIEAGDAMVFPGLVDVHVHINEPGRTDWEGFASATRAAAAGGVTTLVDMPLNSVPPTTSPSALRAKRQAAEGQCAVDLGFLGGVVPGNGSAIDALHREGVFGFKCFLCPSGVEEFPPVTAADLREVLPALAAQDALLMVHAELPEFLQEPAGDPRRYATWLHTRPVAAEVRAVELLIDLARDCGARVHVVHVSSSESAELIREARAGGVRITGETCPHYLTFAADEIPDGATEYKCAPPLRDPAAREALWQALHTGALTLVASDHSPAPPALKRQDSGDFLQAWGGIASLQLRLPALWTLARRHEVSPHRLVDWLCSAPARLVGLEKRKGAIIPGCDADLVLWRPEAEFVVEAGMLRHRHPLTPWQGRRLAGVVEATYLRGELVYRFGARDQPVTGRLLSPNES
jgi:allantoinase